MFWPWIELLIELPIDATVLGPRGSRYVSNEPFATSEQHTHICPYCTLPPDADDYDYRYPEY